MSKAHYDEMAKHGVLPDRYSAFYPDRLEMNFEDSSPSMTRQEFADECDVNKIMERYEKGGMFPPMDPNREPMYLDFVGMPDLQQALACMMDAEEAFMRLPAVVRKEFDNDAMRFVEYAQNGDNLEQLRKWGLAEPEKAPDAPMRVEVVNPVEAPAIAPGAPEK